MTAINKIPSPRRFLIRPIPFVFVLIFALTLSTCRRGQVEQRPAQDSEHAPAQGSKQDQNADLRDLQVRLTPHKGDIDEMDKRRMVRALVSFNKVSFFFDNGRPRGMAYDALLDFETFLNRKLHPMDRTHKEKIEVVLVPTTAASAGPPPL